MNENMLKYVERPISEGRDHSTWISSDYWDGRLKFPPPFINDSTSRYLKFEDKALQTCISFRQNDMLCTN